MTVIVPVPVSRFTLPSSEFRKETVLLQKVIITSYVLISHRCMSTGSVLKIEPKFSNDDARRTLLCDDDAIFTEALGSSEYTA